MNLKILGLLLVTEAFMPPQQLQLRRHQLRLPVATPADENFPGDPLDLNSKIPVSKETKASSVMSTSFSVMKAMLGTGLLSLPSGLAAISNYPSILWAGCGFFTVIAALSAYTFSLYGRLTHAYFPNASNLGDLWQAVYKSDKKPTLIPLSNFVYCFGCALAYLLVIGDSVSSLLGGGATGWSSRPASILAMTGGVLWPLCSLKSLASLAPLSLLGVAGTAFTTAFLAWRCPAVNPGSPYAGLFCTYNRVASPAPLLLIAMSCVALMAHFSAPEFYHAMSGRNANGEDSDDSVLKKFNLMTGLSYSAVTLISMAAMAFGFLTFGGNSQGIILNNYPATDFGAKVSKSLIVTSVVGGFPFVFDACRSAALQLWGKGQEGEKKKITALLLSVLTGIGLLIKDAGFVISFNGALTGTAIIYIFPALLYLKHTSENHLTGTTKTSLERYFCKFLIGLGAACSVLGAVTSVLHSYFPRVLGI